jgi:hypothetical protein
MSRDYIDPCDCGSGDVGRAIVDGYGIFLTFACEHCRARKLARFRLDIFERYECDEPIEEE